MNRTKSTNDAKVIGISSKRAKKPVIKSLNPKSYSLIEILAKLGVSLLLSGVAISAIIQLIPAQKSYQAKLKEVQSEVVKTQKRVNNLRNQFQRSFDPKMAKTIMQEQTYLVDPTQRQVIWVDPNQKPPN